MPRKKTQSEFEKELYNKFGIKYTVLGIYDGNKIPIRIRNNACGHEYSPIPNNLLRGTGCPICANNQKKTLLVKTY